MNIKTAAAVLALIALPHLVKAQAIVQPWHVSDNGGGMSSGGGIVLQASTGQAAIAIMLSSGTDLESGFIPGVIDFSGANATLSTSVSDGWNLLSVPVAPTDSSKTTLFPTSTSSAFDYSGGYVVSDYLRTGVGYWLKFSSASSVTLSGATVQQESVAVANGWNMIGPPSAPVAASGITPVGTAVASLYFSYSTGSGYIVADTLQPGEGYWVKVNGKGTLVLGSSPSRSNPRSAQTAPSKAVRIPALSSTSPAEGIDRLTITDALEHSRTIFFSTSRKDLDPADYELPPCPPSGTMDVRFSANRLFESATEGAGKEVPIVITSAFFPIKIGCRFSGGEPGAALIVDGKLLRIWDSQEVIVEHPTSSIRLRLQGGGVVDLPKTFALYQNYPNPFNPTTVIRYDLPEDAHVALRIYNGLGQLVSTLRDDIEAAGYRAVQWKSENDAGTTVASGLYFYRLEAVGTGSHHTSFTQVRKMLLIR